MSKLIDKIKIDMLNSRKENLTTKDVIKVLYSEIELTQNRRKQKIEEVEDTTISKIISKLIDSNQECLNHYSKKYLSSEDNKKVSKLKDEIIYLSDLMPKSISVDEIRIIINENKELKNKIDIADNRNKLIGEVIKFFKEKEISVESKDVSRVIISWNKN